MNGGDLNVLPAAANADELVLFDPLGVSPANVDQQLTVRRIKVSDRPVFMWGDTLVGFQTGVVELKWWVVIADKQVPAPIKPAGFTTLYPNGWDILAMGSEQAQCFGAQPLIQPMYNWFDSSPWIDVSVARKLEVNELVVLILEANYLCDLAVLEDPAVSHWCVRTDISVLYQRTMRKR